LEIQNLSEIKGKMMLKPFCTFALALGMASSTFADVVLPNVIASKMVLQQGVSAPIWGWAHTGEVVTVTFAGQVKTAIPDAKGKWMVELDPLTASTESRVMTIQGKNSLQLDDVLVGEVWIAAGQSNMEWTFHQIVPEEVAYANAQSSNSLVRAFHVDQHITAGMPLDDTAGSWKNAAEMMQKHQSVSAVGFFFALKLQQELGIPVALLDANWGGQRIEPFIPDVGYQAVGLNFRKHPANPDPKAIAAQLRAIAASVNTAIEAADNGRKIPFLTGNRVYGHAENGIYNAMVAPLLPYAVKGAIWYQGESNRGSIDYFQKLRALSSGWSTVFKVTNMPFYQVQIAPYDYSHGNPNDNQLLCDNIWAAQYRGAAEIPGMGIVAIHDTNINVRDIHPQHKMPVGERLAAQALKNQYGRDVVATGPSFTGAVLNGSRVVVSFKNVDQGLTTSDNLAPSWFELSADGKNFEKAEAVINGNTVEVSAGAVPAPAFVRMGWDETAIPNLKDKNGWPVFAFPGSKVTSEQSRGNIGSADLLLQTGGAAGSGQ
jgi:sialate O-acetylesterase